MFLKSIFENSLYIKNKKNKKLKGLDWPFIYHRNRVRWFNGLVIGGGCLTSRAPASCLRHCRLSFLRVDSPIILRKASN